MGATAAGPVARVVPPLERVPGEVSYLPVSVSLGNSPPPEVHFASFHLSVAPAWFLSREDTRAYCGDMTTWSVAGGTSPRASLSM